MKVIACAGRYQVRLEERERPVAGRGELLLELRACGLCGTDVFKLAAGSEAPGSVLGHEVVGSVLEGGEGTGDFRPGDRVVVSHHVPCGSCPYCLGGSPTMCPAFRRNLLDPGGFSELVRVQEPAVSRTARKLPAALGDERALFMEPGACVLHGVRRSGLGAGGTAAVLGAGSMGLLHLLVLRALWEGLEIFAVDPLASRRTLALRFGATAALEPRHARAGVLEATEGRGADAVFDTAGGAGALEAAHEVSRRGSTIVLFAHAPPGEKSGLDINRFFKEERRLVAAYSSTPEEQAEVFDLLGAGRLDPAPLVSHRLPFSRFSEGLRLVRERHALKVLFHPDGGAAAAPVSGAPEPAAGEP